MINRITVPILIFFIGSLGLVFVPIEMYMPHMIFVIALILFVLRFANDNDEDEIVNLIRAIDTHKASD